MIFTSDNGYYHGEHRLGDKRSAYEESMRVPMLVRYPKLGANGEVVDTAVINIDIAPTMLDYAGVTPRLRCRAAVGGPCWKANANWRRTFFYCYSSRVRMVRTPNAPMAVAQRKSLTMGQWERRMGRNCSHPKADPYEMKNLINDQAHAELRKPWKPIMTARHGPSKFQIPSFADKPPLEVTRFATDASGVSIR